VGPSLDLLVIAQVPEGIADAGINQGMPIHTAVQDEKKRLIDILRQAKWGIVTVEAPA
jgi:hypothetical protein